jgi:hypothetical protein
VEKNQEITDIWKDVNNYYKQLYDNLETELPYHPHLMGAQRTPLLVDYIKTALKYRIVNLSKNNIQLFEKNELLSAMILTRSIFETSALLFSVYKKLERAVIDKEIISIENFIERVAIGSRYNPTQNPKGEEVLAYNIMSAIDMLDKTFKGIKRDYDLVSEFAHPNHSGALSNFANIVNNEVVKFSNEMIYEHIEKPKAYPLHLFCISLEIFILSETEINKLSPKFDALIKK